MSIRTLATLSVLMVACGLYFKLNHTTAYWFLLVLLGMILLVYAILKKVRMLN